MVSILAAAAANAAEDSFYVAIGSDGKLLDGGGSGYERGTWYLYPSGWYNQWFDNAPFDPDRKKVIELRLVVEAAEPKLPSTVRVALNWSTPEWSALGRKRPPLPGESETLYIRRYVVLQANYIPPNGWPITTTYEIPDYNPEWVSIDVQGQNFVIADGWIKHECVAKDQQACCFQDGTCANLTPTECKARMGVSKGVGTKCLGDSNNNKIDDACEQPAGCGPTTDGQRCQQVTCPSPNDQCVPTKIQVNYNTSPPRYTVLECKCLPPNTCHVAIDPPAYVYCIGTCPPGTAQQCNLYATDNGDGTVDYECACSTQPQTPQACCFPNGGCQNLSPANCILQGGWPQGTNTQCQGDQNNNGIDDACEKEPSEQEVACCMPDGTCRHMKPMDCLTRGGSPQAPGSQCGTPAACCMPDGTCVMTDRTCCREAGGTYQGMGTTCANVNCPQPLEACCLPDGTCIDATANDCRAKGGTPQGPGTDCKTVRCGAVEIDTFGVAGRIELDVPGIGLVRPLMSGQATQRVLFEGDLGQANDDDGNGRDEVQTELLQLDLTGVDPLGGQVKVRLHPTQPSPGQMEESINRTPGTLDVDPFTAGGTADSFFDVFVEVEMPGVGLTLRGQVPKRLRAVLTRKAHGHCDTYQNAEQTPLVDANGNIKAFLGLVRITIIIAGEPPCEACCLSDGTCIYTTKDDCTNRGGTAQGAGTDCSTVSCLPAGECDWNEGDPHKMHWPQLPDLSDKGIDVDMYWLHLADDFKCTATGPILDVHIWGSFWHDVLPDGGPGSLTFRLTIYSNVPAEADTTKPWSRPGEALWTRTFKPGDYTVRQVHEGPEGWSLPVPTPTLPYQPNDHKKAYQYNFCIQENPFVQEEGKIYWLEVKDLPPAAAGYLFGWKTTTRELRWNDDAVYGHPDIKDWKPTVYPDGHAYQGQTLDFAFVITGEEGPPPPPQACCFDDGTCQNLTSGQCAEKGGTPQGPGTDCSTVNCIPGGECDWNAGDPHKMHWPQLPDLTPTGMDIHIGRRPSGIPCSLADDFLCTATGAITDIHIWGSFKDDILPKAGLGSLTFKVTIHSNTSDNKPDFVSAPLWSRTFSPGQYTFNEVYQGPEDWYDLTASGAHYQPANHQRAYQYNFCIEQGQFVQQQGRIYWLSVEDVSAGTEDYTFGWKTTTLDRRWGSDAFFWPQLHAGGWWYLKYPQGHEYSGETLDLAFVITGEEGPPPQPQACCFDDGTCQNLTPSECAEKGGLPQGAGTDCSTVSCLPAGECDWNAGDPHKMHWPQLPDLTSTGIDVAVYYFGLNIGDDFLCTAAGPLTDIHLWGSFENDILPKDGPGGLTFYISIWSNAPADADKPWSRPQDILWNRTFGPGRYTVRKVYEGVEGWYNPRQGQGSYNPADHKCAYQYNFCIDEEPFVQQEGTIYWLLVECMPGNPDEPQYRFGWKTTSSDLHWNDDAVWFEPMGVDSMRHSAPLKYPDGHPLAGRTLDLAFVITGEEGPPPQPQACCLPDGTCQNLTPSECAEKGGTAMGAGTDCANVVCPGPGPGGCIWQVGDPHKMHFPQLPNRQGWDVDVTTANLSADDWKCSETGPVTDIHFWYSWLGDKVGIIDSIRVGIYSNIPAAESGTGYSIPGKLLWERAFGPGQFNLCYYGQGNQGFMMPRPGVIDVSPNDHKNIYQCDIVGIANPFIQREGTIYWLALSVAIRDPLRTHIGWKTSKDHFEDDAVYDVGPAGWWEWRDLITGASLDLAFVITGEKVPVCDWNEGDPHKMHHPQLPDLSDKGMDVDVFLTHLADDFKCTATGPIKDIHFWGSFADDILPPGGPGSLTFIITIHGDIPATTDRPWSTPGEVLWTRTFGPGQYTVRQVYEGAEDWYDPTTGRYQKANHKKAYQYNFCIEDDLLVQEEGKIYWLEVAYSPLANADYTFGWKTTTRELRWNDDAVFLEYMPGIPSLVWRPMVYPDGHAYQGETLDLAFVITGEEVPPCDWNEGDPHKMHWPQQPDLTDAGVDVDMFWAPLADDFKCTASGPIQDIHVWGSFADDILPVNGPGSLTFKIDIHGDIPATSAKPWSTPGEVLWSRTFGPGEYSVRLVHEGPEGWYDPATEAFQPNNHKKAYQYNFCIEDSFFVQEEGKIYWLQVKDIQPANADYTFGWKTTKRGLHWNDDAVFLHPNVGWLPLVYPATHRYEGETLDLAFVITGGVEVRPEHELGDAPDSSNSWPIGMTAYPKGGPPGVPAQYPTVYGAGSPPYGPIHQQPNAVAYLGNAVSLENEADIGPDEDGINNLVPPNDRPDLDAADDGVQVPLLLPHCQQATFDYVVTVAPLPIEPPPLYVNVWLDWNRDGDWNDVSECPDGTVVPEWAVQNQVLNLVTSGPHNITTPKFMCWHPAVAAAERPIWMRITLSERQWGMVLSAARAGGDGPPDGYQYGETEDYYFVPKQVVPVEYDFGDAPTGDFAPGYPTLLVHAGARHVIRGPWLGNDDDKPDAEPDGQPDPDALGDDHDILYGPANDDEDGAFIPPLVRGAAADITVRVNGGGGIVQVWIDFNGNQIWELSERIHNAFLPDGTHNIPVTVPNTAVLGKTFARFRISSTGGLGPGGLAGDGEVEDHAVFIEEPPPDIKWPQWPDLTPNGINIRVDTSDGKLRTLADDFKCTSYSRLTDIHLWGSWKNDKKGRIRRIHLSIHADDPAGAGGSDPQNRFSKPDQQVLWAKDLGPGEFTETPYCVVPDPGEWWWDPVTEELIRAGDTQVWQIDIEVDPAAAFLQNGSPDRAIIYWLDVQVDTEAGQFGWKTRGWPEHYMDDAVWDVGSELPRLWKELRYPPTHPYHGLERDSIDMAFLITGKEVTPPAKPTAEHLKWSQPPVEIDPRSKTPLYCGWDELSFSIRPSSTTAVLPTVWRMVADDFRCLGTMPITSVHWWGSYEGWDSPEAPAVRPTGWRIGFWSNVPADPLAKPGHSFPKKLLWYTDVSADRVHQERVGIDRFAQKPSDTCFQYYVQLEPKEYFWQHRYIDSATGDDVFWISITAIYPPVTLPFHQWGWKTRPSHWMDDAVKFTVEGDLPLGYANDFPLIFTPIEAALCGQRQSFDMAFELDTDPNYIKAEQPFTGLRDWRHYEDEQSMAVVTVAANKWRQPPDLSEMGMDVDATKDLPTTWRQQMLADDFKCEASGPITHIRLWTSWYKDILPANYPEHVVFTLTIHKDIPAGGSITPYSMPGEVLWERKFERGQFQGTKYAENLREGWYVPCTPAVGYQRAADTVCWQYDFDIPASEAFPQEKGKIYWLAVQTDIVHAPLTEATRFGWKTSTRHWNDDAVWRTDTMPISRPWEELRYPQGHPWTGQSIDLAFEIITGAGEEQLDIRRLVADDWPCDQRTPITAAVWWGSYIGYRYRACDCPQISPPAKPDYFLLSIWNDVRPSADVPYSHPGEKVWEYKAEDYDEVLVGYDKHPEILDPTQAAAFEPVFRYSVRLPKEKWFCQKEARAIYWFSVVAVYEGDKEPSYPWGWTNHKCVAWEDRRLTEVLHWKLDETGGTTADDSSANNNDGTLIGDPTWQPCQGIICGALDLDGDGDYVKVDSPTGLNFAPGSFSVSVWVSARKVTDGWRTILEYDRDGTNNNRFGLWLSSEGRFHFRVGKDTKNSNQTLNANQWYLLTGTYDSTTKSMNLYIDGQFDTSYTHSAGYEAAAVAKLTMGVRGSEDAEYFDGLIDDVRIYSYLLSADNIRALADMGRNDDAVVGRLDTSGAAPVWKWQELYDQTGCSEDMSFMLFTEPGCFPCSYSTYNDWLALGKPDCWCRPPYGSGYQCDGDADGRDSGGITKYRVFTGDLSKIVANWKKKTGDPALDPCADIDHKDSGGITKYRVFTGDLSKIVTNWKKKDSELRGDCPRPE
jgi:hypothetical protein